jgi:hypothetical protein
MPRRRQPVAASMTEGYLIQRTSYPPQAGSQKTIASLDALPAESEEPPASDRSNHFGRHPLFPSTIVHL